MNIAQRLTSLATASALRKPSPIRKMAHRPPAYFYECKPCHIELEGPSHGYATSIVCHSCGEYVDAQENPLLRAYMNGRADVLNEQSVKS